MKTEICIGRAFADQCLERHAATGLDSQSASMAKYWYVWLPPTLPPTPCSLMLPASFPLLPAPLLICIGRALSVQCLERHAATGLDSQSASMAKYWYVLPPSPAPYSPASSPLLPFPYSLLPLLPPAPSPSLVIEKHSAIGLKSQWLNTGIYFLVLNFHLSGVPVFEGRASALQLCKSQAKLSCGREHSKPNLAR